MDNRKLQKSTIATTIAIILILAFTLSTATFAWFSSSNKVTVNITEFTADASGGSLSLQWYGLDIPGNTEISMDTPPSLAPMAPLKKATFNANDDPTAWSLADERRLNKFKDSFYTAHTEADNKFASDGISTSPYLTQYTGEDDTVYQFMQVTPSQDVTTGVRVTAAFAEAANQSGSQKGNHKRLRVAIFQYVNSTDQADDPTNISDYCYVGTLGYEDENTTENEKRIAFGLIKEGYDAGESGYMLKTPDNTTKGYEYTRNVVQFYLPADGNGIVLKGNQSVYLTCIVWYDGHLLTTTSGAGGTASVKLTFSIS